MCNTEHKEVIIIHRRKDNYGAIDPSRKRGYTIQDCGCWEYDGFLDKDGYPLLCIYREDKTTTTSYVYRYYFEKWVRTIPNGMEMDHLCYNRKCINPSHLQPVTHAENVRRARIQNEIHLYCKNGHKREEVGTYTYLRNGKERRTCKACRDKSVSDYNEQRRIARKQLQSVV